MKTVRKAPLAEGIANSSSSGSKAERVANNTARRVPFQQRRSENAGASNTSSSADCIDLCEDDDDSPYASTVSPSPPPSVRGQGMVKQPSAASTTSKRGGNHTFMNWREQKRRRESGGAGRMAPGLWLPMPASKGPATPPSHHGDMRRRSSQHYKRGLLEAQRRIRAFSRL